MVASLCLIAAPAVLFAGGLSHPRGEDAAAAHLAIVAQNPNRYYAAHAILLAGLALFLGAILALVHLIGERPAVLGPLGGGLAMIGLLGATAIVAMDGLVTSQMAQPEADRGEMAALLDRIKEFAGLRAIAGVSAIAFLLGMLLLAYGLWRTARPPRWTASAIAAGAIVFLIAQVTDNPLIFALAFAVYLVALAPLGWQILHESDEEWSRRVAPE
jgi:hypothetical protein